MPRLPNKIQNFWRSATRAVTISRAASDSVNFVLSARPYLVLVRLLPSFAPRFLPQEDRYSRKGTEPTILISVDWEPGATPRARLTHLCPIPLALAISDIRAAPWTAARQGFSQKTHTHF